VCKRSSAQLVPDSGDALDVPEGLDDVNADLARSGRPDSITMRSWTVTCRSSGVHQEVCGITRSVTSRRICSGNRVERRVLVGRG
jgi:hypothetical protein